MGGITTTLFQRPRDPQFNNTTLLLSGNFPTNGAQNNTFLDSSRNNFSITRNGNTTQGSFSPFSQTGWSNYFDGSNSYLYQDSLTNWKFLHDGSSWTIEFDIFHSSTSLIVLMATARTTTNVGFSVQLNSVVANDVSVYFFNGSSIPSFSSTGNLVINQWNHVGITFDGTTKTCTFYINGTQRGSSSNTGYSYSASNSSFGLYVGAEPSTLLYDYTGYLASLRISSVVRTGMTTVPNSAYTSDANTKLLTCQSNRFVDQSNNAYAISVFGNPSVQAFSPFVPSGAYTTTAVGGSGYFDGTGDYLTATDSALVATGDFTVEAWVYCTQTGASQGVVSTSDSIDIDGFRLAIDTSNRAEFWFDTTFYITSTKFQMNAWNHMAMVRSGTASNNISCYLNGERVGQGSLNNSTANTTLAIGRYRFNQDANYFRGYISGARYLVGTALYSGATITVPTEPPTAITNTVLLLNFTNAGIVDSTAKNVLETVGSAQISTAVSRFGGSSMSFDGTTDYVVEPTNVNFGYGTGDFTIEFWLRLNSTALQTVVSNLTSATSLNPHVYIASGGSIRYFTSNADRITGSTLSTNQWYHIAVCRSGTSTRLFIDGTQSGSTYTDSNNYGTTAPLGIGTYWASGTPNTADTLNGYIDDLRITKFARYTANFNVPTIGFTDR